MDSHPVFLALPVTAQAAILAEVRQRHLAPGESVPDGATLSLITSGLLVRQSAGSGVAVGLIGPGAALGWETAATGAVTRLRALEPVQLWETPIQPVVELMGQSWLHQLVARQAVMRLEALETDAACNASHLLLPRLAKWLLRLHRASNSSSLMLTQATLAEMLGVQRTSVNAAALQLQATGVVRFRRSRIEVTDPRGLAAMGCCGA